MTNREKLDAKITEAQWGKTVEDLLDTYGWHWVHFRPGWTEKGWRTAITGTKGFPDYVAMRQNRLVFIELKSEQGKLSDEQRDWQAWLHLTCAEVNVARPSDFDLLQEALKWTK